MKFIKKIKDFFKTEELVIMGIKNYTLNEDGSIDVNGDVDLRDIWTKRNFYEKIEIPVKFRDVTGSFNVSSTQLSLFKIKSLEGSPRYVGGDFDCSFNKLKDLKGSPIEVCGDFYCASNKLETLEGMSSEISGNFYCDNNPDLKILDSLSNIEGYIYCDKNVDISKFKGYCKGFKYKDGFNWIDFK